MAPTTTGTGPATTEPRISDPAQAAKRLFDAWQAGDRQRALCAWNAKGDTGISMLVVGGASAGWRVESVEFVGDSD